MLHIQKSVSENTWNTQYYRGGKIQTFSGGECHKTPYTIPYDFLSPTTICHLSILSVVYMVSFCDGFDKATWFNFFPKLTKFYQIVLCQFKRDQNGICRYKTWKIEYEFFSLVTFIFNVQIAIYFYIHVKSSPCRIHHIFPRIIQYSACYI